MGRLGTDEDGDGRRTSDPGGRGVHQDDRRKATLKDVAAEAGVHVSTVSRALSPAKRDLVNTETRAQIEQVARRLDFRPDKLASSLRSGRTNVIGVVVADLSNPYIGPVLRGIENTLGGSDVMPMLVETRDSSERLARACDALIDHRVDAVITTAGRQGDVEALRRVAARVPLALAVRAVAGVEVPTIAHDDVLGGRLAAEHLLGLGHTRLAQLVGPDDISSFRDRRRGFREAVEAAGHAVVDVADAATVLPTIDEGGRLMRRLLTTHRGDLPTGLFVHNDTMAVGAVDAARAGGLRCPHDLSVVGYNNNPLTAHVEPPLTTIHLPGYELGRMAADVVVGMLDTPETTPTWASLPPHLVVRESTAAPRA